MSQRYRIRVTARAERDLDRLPEKIGTAAVEFIFGSLAESPRRVGKPLRDELAGLLSARRGDYRVLYAIDEETHQIEIVHIGRRSDVYR